MTKIIHPIAGTIGFVTIAIFWITTVGFELFGSMAQIVAVKSTIPYGLILLIPAMAAVGVSGFRLAGKRRAGLLGAKARRMPIIAANGILILVPAALFLAWKAKAGQFDGLFYAVQLLELAVGAINLTLMGLSMRDGLQYSGRLHGRATQNRPEPQP